MLFQALRTLYPSTACALATQPTARWGQRSGWQHQAGALLSRSLAHAYHLMSRVRAFNCDHTHTPIARQVKKEKGNTYGMPMRPSFTQDRVTERCYVHQCVCTSHVTRHTSHVTRCTSYITRHTSHVTRYTSHVTRHTSHVTRHTSYVTQVGATCNWRIPHVRHYRERQQRPQPDGDV